jgi:MoxR-like ATPase
MSERVANLEAIRRAPRRCPSAAQPSSRRRPGRIATAVNGFIQGKAEVVDLALVCLLAEGHLLLEDVPGRRQDVARAQPRRAPSGRRGSGSSSHPDLLPGDVTGVSVFHQDASEFVFHPGPCSPTSSSPTRSTGPRRARSRRCSR